MNYYDSDDNKGKLWGGIGVAIYIAALVALFFCVSYTIDYTPPEEGFIVDFGNSEQGLGADDSELADVAPLPQSSDVPRDEQIVTRQDSDEPEVVVTQPKPSRKPEPVVEKPVVPTKQKDPEPQQVDKRALFPGNSAKPSTKSQGDSQGEGNKGSMDGEKSDSYAEGSGTSTTGTISFSLSGRRPRGEFPRPAYRVDDQGKVVVEITVNSKGDVTSAKYRSSGSTTNSQPLVDEALKAARGAKFNEDADNEVQTGTIVYVFKLK